MEILFKYRFFMEAFSILLKDLLIQRGGLQKVAVVDGDIELSYAELMRRADRCREAIQRITKARAHISILMPNSASYVIAYCAILLAGCVVVPLYHKATKQEIEHAVHACDVQILLTNSEYRSKLEEAVFTNRLAVMDIDSLSVNVYAEDQAIAIPQSPQTVSVMLGTSGSTSDPKRVMLSDENLIQNAKSIIHSLQYSENERILAVLPLTFASGNTSQLVVSLLLSATLYMYHGMVYPKFFFSAIHKYGITSTTIVPSVLKILLADDNDHVSECETLRVVCFGGGPTDEATIAKLKKNSLCNRFVHMYGQTEASTRVSHLHFSKEAHKTPSVGKPLRNVNVSIARDDETTKMGEIIVQGPNVMVGYYRETVQSVKNGMLYTGDIGYLDEEGYLYITGRKKNVIICSGMNIYAEEVEDVLCCHPQVAEALVYGVPDSQHGELPAANVVLKPLAKVTSEELREFCAERLSAYKIPACIRFVNELERTYNGKLARGHMVAEIPHKG